MKRYFVAIVTILSFVVLPGTAQAQFSGLVKSAKGLGSKVKEKIQLEVKKKDGSDAAVSGEQPTTELPKTSFNEKQVKKDKQVEFVVEGDQTVVYGKIKKFM